MSTPKDAPYKITQQAFRLLSRIGRLLRDGERRRGIPTHSAQRRDKRARKAALEAAK